MGREPRACGGGADDGFGGANEFVHALPSPPLRPYIAWYSGYRQRGLPPGRHRGLPSPFLTLIFTLDEPLEIRGHPDPRQAPGSYDTLLGGLHATPALITHPGAQSGVQVALHPLGARVLLGMPAGELSHVNLSADAVLGPACDEVRARIRDASGWPARFAVLDDVLGRLARADRRLATAVTPEVAWAWKRLLRAGGTMPVAELAAEIGWSSRHLANRFRVEIGLTPKTAARVVRFDRARRLLAGRVAAVGADPRSWSGLADLAVECGYFDQAHLAREFRALAGCPPSRWLAEEFQNVQAGTPAFAELLVLDGPEDA